MTGLQRNLRGRPFCLPAIFLDGRMTQLSPVDLEGMVGPVGWSGVLMEMGQGEKIGREKQVNQ